jgi:hypothetical protein
MWDNERILDYYETEQERIDKLHRRLEIEEEMEEKEWQHCMNLQDNLKNC